MDRKNTEYLSHRVFLLSAAAALLILFLLLFCLKMIIFEEGSLWPFFLGLTAFLGIIGASFYFVVKPYLRFEKMMRLFTDGYTTMEISDLYDVTPTPAGYRLLERMNDMMDSSELLDELLQKGRTTLDEKEREAPIFFITRLRVSGVKR